MHILYTSTQNRGAEYTTAHIGPLEGSSSSSSDPPTNGTEPDNPDLGPTLLFSTAEAEVVDMESYNRWFLVHVLGAYYMTAVVLVLLWRAYVEYLRLRHAFRQRPAPENYTVLVHHIPGAMRSNAAIAAYFEALFPGSVKKVGECVGVCMYVCVGLCGWVWGGCSPLVLLHYGH